MASSQDPTLARVRTVPGGPASQGAEYNPSTAASSDHGECRDCTAAPAPIRTESSPSRHSFSSLLSQKTPARSFFHRSFHSSRQALDIPPNTSQSVREDTAELASWALSDIASSRSGRSPPRSHTASFNQYKTEDRFANGPESAASFRTADESPRPEVIPEVSEPSSPRSGRSPRPGMSTLTAMIKQFPPIDEDDTYTDEEGDEEAIANTGVRPVTVREGIISQPKRETTLLLQRAANSTRKVPTYGSFTDPENQKHMARSRVQRAKDVVSAAGTRVVQIARILRNPKSWDLDRVWTQAVQRPAGYVPPVILGLLLNVLDALSYGMILFPLGEPIFASLGPDGISMFYVSCITSQLVYSLGGSVFKGGIGSEMIEVVPFFHTMAYSILNHVGSENPRRVIATTILAYSLSAILTGVVFFLMGKCGLGSLIGFFPRHILVGCIGGVGWFLIDTGVGVAARLEGSLEYNLNTLHKLFQPETVALWTIPLALAVTLTIMKRWVKHPLTDATFFLMVIAIFYYFVLAIPDLNLSELRSRGWVFDAPPAGVPFWHFYTLYDFEAVDWVALGRTVPAMLALTFFGILHVPINIPALGMTTGEDNLDVDRELRAHGISNALSGLCGSIQNYLVYTNTVLFMRSGGDSRFAGVLLACGTFGILVIGPVIIGYIPIMVVGSLIFFLGIDLLREALVDTWGKVHRLEYVTIIIIIVTMGAWDFVYGILVGILLACVSFVFQTSQVSAIRGELYGGVANSTVRRHPIQHRFLQDAGQQIHVMKLAGYLFFGTIVGVEKNIKSLLNESFQERPIRFLVLDLFAVDGVDFSAAEAFSRVNRLLNTKHVQLVICGLAVDGKVQRSLRNVGLFDKDDGVEYFVSLNSALEHCENELLKTLYHHRDTEYGADPVPAYLDVPRPERNSHSLSPDLMFSSPRKYHLQQVATTTLCEQNPASPSRWQDYRQPLQLILQTFSTVSDRPEEFWYPTVPYFRREQHAAGSVLYRQGDVSIGFYLLESGILKAKYDFPQGGYSELIVAGTTCGELPFFSSTPRTATTYAERDSVTWMLDQERWQAMQEELPRVAQELLTLSLKLTSERMDAVTKYMLLTTG